MKSEAGSGQKCGKAARISYFSPTLLLFCPQDNMITVQLHKERGGGGIGTKRDPADDAVPLLRGPASLRRLVFSRALALFISTFNWTFCALPLPPFILAPLPVTYYFPKGDRGKGSRPFSDNLVHSDLSFLPPSERMFREHNFLYRRSSVGVDGKFRLCSVSSRGLVGAAGTKTQGSIIKKFPAGSKCRLR